jgi:hypothetical protein
LTVSASTVQGIVSYIDGLEAFLQNVVGCSAREYSCSLHEEVKRRHEQARTEALARAKASAAGKEPFDLAKLEALAATDALGKRDTAEEQSKS